MARQVAAGRGASPPPLRGRVRVGSRHAEFEGRERTPFLSFFHQGGRTLAAAVFLPLPRGEPHADRAMPKRLTQLARSLRRCYGRRAEAVAGPPAQADRSLPVSATSPARRVYRRFCLSRSEAHRRGRWADALDRRGGRPRRGALRSALRIRFRSLAFRQRRCVSQYRWRFGDDLEETRRIEAALRRGFDMRVARPPTPTRPRKGGGGARRRRYRSRIRQNHP